MYVMVNRKLVTFVFGLQFCDSRVKPCSTIYQTIEESELYRMVHKLRFRPTSWRRESPNTAKVHFSTTTFRSRWIPSRRRSSKLLFYVRCAPHEALPSDAKMFRILFATKVFPKSSRPTFHKHRDLTWPSWTRSKPPREKRTIQTCSPSSEALRNVKNAELKISS